MTPAQTPPQTAPVRRPELVMPHRCVDVVHGSGEQLIRVRMGLMHGANYNDPQYQERPGYERMKVSRHGG